MPEHGSCSLWTDENIWSFRSSKHANRKHDKSDNRFYCLWYWGSVLLWDFSDASTHCSERELFTLSQTFLLMLWLYVRRVGCLNRSSLCFYIRVSCYDSIFSFGWDFYNNDLMLMISNYVTRRKSHKVNQEFRLRPPTEPPCFVSLNNLFGHRKH